MIHDILNKVVLVVDPYMIDPTILFGIFTGRPVGNFRLLELVALTTLELLWIKFDQVLV